MNIFKRLSGIPAASNDQAGATVNPLTGLPEPIVSKGGATPASTLLGRAKNYANTNRNQMGYMLGMAASAVMGEHQGTPAAQLGQLGAGMAKARAYKSVAAKMLTGTALEDIPDASILSPEEQTVLLQQDQLVKTNRHKQLMDRNNYELALRKQDMDEAEIQKRMDLYDQQIARAKFENENAETPEQRRARDTQAKETVIAAQGEEDRKTVVVQGEQNRKTDAARIAAMQSSNIAQLKAELKLRKEAASEDALDIKTLGTLAANLQLDLTDPEQMKSFRSFINEAATATGGKAPFVVEEPAKVEGPPARGLSEKEYYKQFEDQEDQTYGPRVTTVQVGYGAPQRVIEDPAAKFSRYIKEGFGSEQKPLYVKATSAGPEKGVRDLPVGTIVIINGIQKARIEKNGKVVPVE